jgi:LemA protein
LKFLLIVAGVFAGALLLFGGCYVSTYNGIVTSEERVDAAWSEGQNQYQRRYDLIPQLVETVKGAADFEQSTIPAVTEARASVGKVNLPSEAPTDPAQLQAWAQAQQTLSTSLSRLLLVAENYPNLKASQNFLSLQDNLAGTENRIAVARRDFIDSVAAFNVSIRRFPGSVVAGVAGFEKRAQLEVPEASTERPEIDFDFGKDE